MRPRSRLFSKRGLLLPTIREGTEETLRDLNEANTLHTSGHSQTVSSEDYFLSICHLAHPTFPSRDVFPYSSHMQRLDAAHQKQRLSRHSGTPSGCTELNPSAEAHAIDMQQMEGRELDSKLTFGNPDPLEYLYGHQSNPSGGVRRAFEERITRQHMSMREGRARSRAHSIPRASSPDLPHQRKSSFPDLHTSTCIPNVSPRHSLARLEAVRARPAEEEKQNRAVKQSLISQWISDCRSAWREARVRACMLPAIAEI
ncbi:uncharacterized protein V6R79_022700 [Siganus canaliculatus]